ncbi:MAG: hypothetical protein M3Z37_07175 [Candidatus Eremiobacteraeota bacterium]|nr:hypothetical protein [Candidatus Eremiobacteraeota bacterium]
MGLPTAFIVAGACACLAAVSAPSGPPTAQVQLNAARAQLVANFAAVQQRCGCAGDLQARLDSELARTSAPGGSADEAQLLADLEASLIGQVTSGLTRELAPIRGAGATLLHASFDHSLQPLSVFVPPGYERAKSVPLIVLLHASDESENELLASSRLRDLAGRTGALLAVPWARGDSTREAAVASDVYDALEAAEKSFAIDRRRVYLAGVSEGGIAMFRIGPQHAERWTAFLSIAGALTKDDMQDVARAMRGKQIFLVAGGADTFVKPAYVRAAATWLANNGVETHYYEEPAGERTLRSLGDSVERAWQDMLSGIRVTQTAPELDIPSPQPATSRKN